MKEDACKLYGRTPAQYRHSTAVWLQCMSDESMEKDALLFPANSPDRQAFRRAVRWAREQTTEEVVKALTPP